MVRKKRFKGVVTKSFYIPLEYLEVFEKLEKLAEMERKSTSLMIVDAIAEYVERHYPGNPQLPLVHEDMEHFRLQADEMEASREAAYLRYALPRIGRGELGGEARGVAWESALRLARLNRRLRRRRYYELVEEARRVLGGG